MLNCPIHGFAPTYIVSRALLELQPDGTLPDIVTVELGDHVSEMNFFRFNITPAEAAQLPIKDGCIPFDVEGCEIMERYPDMCGFCFAEKRKALAAQQTRMA